MSWVFLLFGLAAVGVGCWMVLNPEQAAKAVQSSQRRGGVGSWTQDEPQMPYRSELGIWLRPGARTRSMRWTGAIAIFVGLGASVMSLVGLAN